MTHLSRQQKELIFDYCVGVTSQEESAAAQELIFSNEEAAELAKKLQRALSPLDSHPHEQCPDELADVTVSRLKAAAYSSQLKLQQLIAQEQGRQGAVKGVFRRNFGRIVLAAAAIYLIVSLYMPSIQQARYRSVCLAQLRTMGQAIASYQNDYDQQLPTVASVEGSPWWKVGYRSDTNENCSNTRHLWLLVRGEYVKPTIFICPGSGKSRGIKYRSINVRRYYDFPSRNSVSYSFRIRCSKSAGTMDAGRKVLIADMNPLFEELPENFDRLGLPLSKELESLNSANHGQKGQNVLFCDGSAEFVRSRLVGEGNDDIFTLQNITLYQGSEIPTCESDAFVAP